MTLKNVYQNIMRDAVKVGHAITNVVIPALTKLEGSKTAIETVTAAVDPAAVAYEDFAFNVGAEFLAVLKAGQTAAESNLTNVGFDVATITAAKTVIASLEAAHPVATASVPLPKAA